MKAISRAVAIAISAVSIPVVASMALSGSAHAAAGHGDAHWSYEGEGGPTQWGTIKQEFTVCKDGKAQSPIDINTTKVKKGTSQPISFNYSDTALRVLNNGHTIQANIDGGSTITVGGVKYNLLQFHFHTPSEYAIDGKTTPLEVHLVHKTDDGKLGVVGVLIEEGPANPTIQAIWEAIGKETNKENKVAGRMINAAELLPDNKKGYYNLPGSLTTPPCSEGVNWMVMKDTITASPQQISAFQKLFKTNARPLQPLNDRVVEIKE